MFVWILYIYLVVMTPTGMAVIEVPTRYQYSSLEHCQNAGIRFPQERIRDAAKLQPIVQKQIYCKRLQDI